MKQFLKPGDKVKFDNDKIDDLIREITHISPEVDQYQKLVLGGINQVGVVKEYGTALPTVSYNDGWELPVPTKYLIILPPEL